MLHKLLIAFATCLLALTTAPAMADDSYGKQRIQSRTIDAEEYADGSMAWEGEDLIDTEQYGKPFKIVLHVKGKAQETAPVTVKAMHWWVVDEMKPGQNTMSAAPGAEIAAGLPQSETIDARYGETVELALQSDLTSFESVKTVLPAAVIEESSNIDISEVRVTVWGEATDGDLWWKMILQAPVLLMAVVMVGLIWWWKQ